MTKDDFISKLRNAVTTFTPFISTKDGQWAVKGFIDVYKHIYTISTDTNIVFFVQEKWKIATDKPGSGNTKNIGSVSLIENLIKGNGIFAKLGEEVFDDYWTNYLTPDMAKKAELAKPYYNNLATYKKFRNLK